MKQFFISLLIFAGLVAMVACGENKKPAEETMTTDDHKGESKVNSITSLTGEQMETIGLEFGVIEDKELTTALKTNGLLRVPNQNKASVNSVYSGIVKTLLAQQGNRVKKGQTIATIANPEFIQVQSDYLEVANKIALAELEVTRQKELNAGNAGSLKNLQLAESELKKLSNLKSTLTQQLQMMGIDPSKISKGRLVSVLSVTSPISGVVSDVKVKMGSYVDVTSPIVEIVDNSQLHLDLSVYEKDLSKLKDRQLIHFTLTNNPGKEYDAEIFSLGSSFEGESKAVAVHAKVMGDKIGLIDGMNVTAIISLQKATVPAVPSEAIVSLQGQDYIFIQTDNNKPKPGVDSLKSASKDVHEHQTETTVEPLHDEHFFEIIPIVKGVSEVGYTQVTLLKEIPKDAKVVVKAAFFVLAKMTNTGEHDH